MDFFVWFLSFDATDMWHAFNPRHSHLTSREGLLFQLFTSTYPQPKVGRGLLGMNSLALPWLKRDAIQYVTAKSESLIGRSSTLFYLQWPPARMWSLKAVSKILRSYAWFLLTEAQMWIYAHFHWLFIGWGHLNVCCRGQCERSLTVFQAKALVSFFLFQLYVFVVNLSFYFYAPMFIIWTVGPGVAKWC